MDPGDAFANFTYGDLHLRPKIKFLNRQYNYANKNRGNAGVSFMRNFILVKPGLYIVVTIAQHACDRVLKRVLKLSTYRLQIFLVKYEYLRLLQLCEDQGIRRKLTETCSQTDVLAILTTYTEARL